MNTSNLKDKLSTICGLLFVIAGAILGAGTQGIVLPPILVTIAGIVATLSGAIVAFLTGKAPNGATKSKSELIAGNDGTNDIGGGTVGTPKPPKP